MFYTPSNINDIVYHSVVERKLINDIAAGTIQFPACGKNGILLYGIYGTGKTTLARLLPEAIERGKGGKIEAVLGQAADLEILDHHIGLGHQRADGGAALIGLEVDGDGLLAAVAAVEIGGAQRRAVWGGDEGRGWRAGSARSECLSGGCLAWGRRRPVGGDFSRFFSCQK